MQWVWRSNYHNQWKWGLLHLEAENEVILVQGRVAKALNDPKKFSTELKAKPDKMACSYTILYLFDNIVRQVKMLKLLEPCGLH